MSLQYNYNKRGNERKALVQAVSEILAQPAVYLGAPSFAYAIGGCKVDKDGVLTVPEDTGYDGINWLTTELCKRGYVPENADAAATEDTTGDATENMADGEVEAGGAGNTDPAATDSAGGDTDLSIEIPKTGFTDNALENLHKIIASKESLLKRALGTDKLPVIDMGDTLSFPWFTLHGLEGEAEAYSQLVEALCRMAREKKRITAREHDPGNDKFDMRLFLVRLGFIGDEYKAARKILLRNLTGNSSWKSGHAPEKTTADGEADASALQPDDIRAGEIPDIPVKPQSQPEEEGGEVDGR